MLKLGVILLGLTGVVALFFGVVSLASPIVARAWGNPAEPYLRTAERSLVAAAQAGRHAMGLDLPSIKVPNWIADRRASARTYYIAHRDQVRLGTQWVRQVADSEPYSLAVLALFVGLLVWSRESFAQLQQLFSLQMEISPFPIAKKNGVTYEQLRIVRSLLFFSCLYILYEAASRFLMFGNHNAISFWANFSFRVALIALMLRSHLQLRASILGRDTISEEKKAKLQAWYDSNFSGLNVSAARVRRIALGIFLLTFGPVAFFHLPGMLDYALM